MNRIKFSLKIKPKGKDRPRFRKIGKIVTTYTTKSTKEYENTIKKAFLEQCGNKCNKEYSGNIKIEIWAFFEPPKSFSKKKRWELIDTSHLKKPDADNVAKAICDALNGVAWKDDSQICDLLVHKYYDEEDMIIVEIEYGKKDKTT